MLARNCSTVAVLVALAATAQQQLSFQNYSVKVEREKPVSPKAETSIARENISVIRVALQHGPNFAGHYTVADWGCGTSCAAFVIVDDRTGRIYEPPEISKGVDLGVAGPEFRQDSSLMVVTNCPPPTMYGLKNCRRKFYRWDGSHLRLLKTEPVTATEKGH